MIVVLHNQRKICSSANLSTNNPTCAGLGSNPGLCSDRPVADYLSNNPICAGLGSNPGLCSDRPVTDYLSISHGKAQKCRWTFQYSLVCNWTTVTLELRCKIVLQTCHAPPPNRLVWANDQVSTQNGVEYQYRILNFFPSSQNVRKFKTYSTYMIHNLMVSFTIHYRPKTRHAHPNNL